MLDPSAAREGGLRGDHAPRRSTEVRFLFHEHGRHGRRPHGAEQVLVGICAECPTLTVAKNLRIALKTMLFRIWVIDATFSIFLPIEYLMLREAESLSGSEMQVVSTARALFFDEPSWGLALKIVLTAIRRTLLQQRRGQQPGTPSTDRAGCRPGRRRRGRSAVSFRAPRRRASCRGAPRCRRSVRRGSDDA